ncbi:cytochrome P450 monooxygenase pc-3 [Crassisporium funariophilum]|nr:cytochrome P450 monooxygenase pc-3 [Crassisporium funariophilum]
MALPPGVQYLIQRLPSLLIPPASVIVLTKVARAQLDVVIPIWAVVIACFFSLPVAIVLRAQYQDFADRRAAAAHGAVLPPQVHDKWPGGIGLLLHSIHNFQNGYPGEMFVEWSAKHGNTLNFKLLFENRYLTTEPEYIKAILATKFDSYEKGPLFDEQMRSMLGTGVFNADGEMWKFHRSMTRPFFSKDRISHFDIFDRHATDALGQLKARLREGHPVDIQDLASRFTMDSATEFLFSSNVHSLGAGLPYPYYHALAGSSAALDHPANRFSRAFDEAQRLSALRGRKGVNWPLSEFWQDKVAEQMVIINNFIDPILANALKRKRELGEGEKKAGITGDREVKDGESLLDHLINYTDDESVLRDETLNILLAGRDTTTNSITYAIYMLAENPHVLQRLRQEILEKVGETRRPTFDDMKDMKYLRAVINETLRLYPAVPFNIRTSNKPVVLPGINGSQPLYIPANSKSPYSVFMMHRRTDLWGPDANEFDPDRFLDERLRKYLTPNPFIFLPFNAGPRICLGQQFAYHETSFFLIRLLQQFSSITHVLEAQPPDSRPPESWKGCVGTKGRDNVRIKSYVTMSVMGGCWLKLEEATSSNGI